ncbi:MAG: sigma-70 family RNA polymerase sigma factor [Verrucomicrobiales bacterium]|nr:sigma-70 family RNA polymerase sigma factor [Verrucomicrobiales bacterium]
MSDTDLELLDRYATQQSEDAFSELVRRHVALVHSAALRQVRSPQLAEEVTQSVFVDLARSATRIAPETLLPAWLHQVTRRTAVDVIRRESRRLAREQTAVQLNSMNAATADWTRIEPLLDQALESLGETDRAAILLRYFEDRPFREVAACLGTTDDAAQKRVERALLRLREFLGRHGIAVGSGVLATLLSEHVIEATPAHLVATILKEIQTLVPVLPVPLRPATIAVPAPGRFRASTFAKVAGVTLVAVTTALAVRTLKTTSERSLPEAMANSGQAGAANAPAGEIDSANPGAGNHEPDPLGLLLRIQRAREGIRSGKAEYEVAIQHYNRPRFETNRIQVTLTFDQTQIRSDQTSQEYAYAYSEDAIVQEDIRKRADAMDRASAVQAGLLEGFRTRDVLTSDGTAVLHFRTHGRKDGSTDASTTIDDLQKGTGYFHFDPRNLGLSGLSSPTSTVQTSLAYGIAELVHLEGRELVDDRPAWHVQIRTKYGGTLDFWVDTEHPERVLRHTSGNSTVVSRYSAPDPLPTEVENLDVRDGRPFYKTVFVRTRFEMLESVDPTLFTLAGLGMPVGTPVNDNRNQRRIGYWTGSGLSEDLPEPKSTNAPSLRQLPELMALLETVPAAPEALEAAQWILANTPDGQETETAAEVLLRDHVRAPGLAPLCRDLERTRPHSARRLLEGILNDNPERETRGLACFILATLLKEESKFGTQPKPTAEAVRLYERVISEFGTVKERGYPLAALAKPELSDLRQLSIGRAAPEINGVDLDGQPMSLSKFRDKVVVLVFWWPDTSELRNLQNLLEQHPNDPFAIVGVYGDNDVERARTELEQKGVTWPSFHDKRDGPIARTWNVQGWPNFWLIDRKGIIRHRGLRDSDLNQAVDALLRE